MAMKCALGFCFETFAMNSHAVAYTPQQGTEDEQHLEEYVLDGYPF
jgi:hypothetical protein